MRADCPIERPRRRSTGAKSLNTDRRGQLPNWLLVAAVSLLAACEATTSRDCPAFNHPLVSDWQPHGIGETAVFADADGANSSFRVASIVNNEPYEESGRGTERDITCLLTSEHVLQSESSDEAFRLIFTQFDTHLAAPESHKLELDLVQEQPVGTEVSQRYFFTPSNPRIDNIESFVRERSFIESMMIGDTEYQNLIDFTYLDNEETGVSFANLAEADFATVLNRVLIGQGVGIVQFERADDSINTVVRP